MATKKRKARAWTAITFDELDAWRSSQRIPKKRMAEMLEVTNSTYHNWARGIAVATPHTQERARRLIDGGASPAATLGGARPSSGEALVTTGQIVAAYLGNKPAGMNPEKLVKLIRDVRRSLD